LVAALVHSSSLAMNEEITGRDKAYHVVYFSIPENVAAECKLPAKGRWNTREKRVS